MGLFGKNATEINSEMRRLARHVNEAEERYLEGLQREVANLIVDSDPDLMISCYQKVWAFEREINANPERAVAEETALVAKFPLFEDFDPGLGDHFQPYIEVRLSNDLLVERYHDISRMLVFMRRRQEHRSKTPVYDEKQRNVLYQCMRREKDRRLLKRMEDVIRRFYAYKAGLQQGDRTGSVREHFEDAEVSVISLTFINAWDEYGIIFKKTDEYGVFGVIFFDSGEAGYRYERSNSTFEERHFLRQYTHAAETY